MRPTIAVLACLALTACGGDDNGSPGTSSSTTTPPTTVDAPVALPGAVNNKGIKDLAGTATLEVDIQDFSFAPTYVRAAAGSKIAIFLKNGGAAAHTFTVDSPKIDVTVGAGASGAASFTAPASGAVAFYCRFHRGQGMQGAIYVTPGATVSGAAGSGDDGGAYGQ